MPRVLLSPTTSAAPFPPRRLQNDINTKNHLALQRTLGLRKEARLGAIGSTVFQVATDMTDPGTCASVVLQAFLALGRQSVRIYKSNSATAKGNREHIEEINEQSTIFIESVVPRCHSILSETVHKHIAEFVNNLASRAELVTHHHRNKFSKLYWARADAKDIARLKSQFETIQRDIDVLLRLQVSLSMHDNCLKTQQNKSLKGGQRINALP